MRRKHLSPLAAIYLIFALCLAVGAAYFAGKNTMEQIAAKDEGPVEDVAQEEPEVPYADPSHDNPNQYTELAIDLDEDSVNENISLAVNENESDGQETILTVNGEHAVLDGHNSQGYFGIVDIDTKDGVREIAVSDLGPSGDYTTSFFVWDVDRLVSIGTISGLYQQMRFLGQGTLTTLTRAAMLDTWFYEDTYTLSDRHALTNVPKDFYPRENAPMQLTMLQDLPLYTSPIDASIVATLRRGEIVTITGCDNVAWCAINNNVVQGWFSLDAEGKISGIGLTPDEMFLGLSNAD